MAKHKYIETPEKLWEYWEEYKSSLPKIEIEVSHPKFGKVILMVPQPIHERGFNVFMCKCYDMGNRTIHAYFSKDPSYESYHSTITRIQDDKFEHNYKYSAVGLHKEKLTMVLLGLAEKINSNVTVQSIQIIEEDGAIS
jgi:hypothetical protein